MDPRTIFLEACNGISTQLGGFKVFEKGQRLRKSSTDKDLYSEIYFQSSSKNNSSHIQILPHIYIFSKALKKWQIEHSDNEYAQGLIFAEQIGYLTPYKNWKEWNIAGLDHDKTLNEITEQIKEYIIPIFDIFDSKEQAINFLKTNGTKFNTWCEYSLLPLDFLLCCSEKETAEQFFNHFVDHCLYKKKIFKLYQELKSDKKIDLNYSEFIGADKIKLAFINGLKITEQ